ncbi:hypothetical protein BH24ACT22_BH24ACT22_04920 [soil metagenome]
MITKYHALLPLLALLAALSSGCSSTGSLGSELPSTAGTGREETREQVVIPTTTGESSGAAATAGVASTIEQTEVVQQEASSELHADEGSVASSPSQPSEPPFVDDSQASGGEDYGADSILGVRYGIHKGYERLVVDLGAGGRPAGAVPEWSLSSPTGDGVLRVTIPSVSTTRVSGGQLDGLLLRNFHVVRAPEVGMFVDFFAEGAFVYRVIEVLDPARIVVDFKPTEATLDLPLPAKNANTVLVEPRRGAGVSGSLTLSGYSRNPEANNTIVLTDDSGKELVRNTVTSNDWTATWGYFETTLDLPSFSGRAKLEVGAPSARDGTFEGVEIPVFGTK